MLTLLGMNIGRNTQLSTQPPLPGCCPRTGGASLMITMLGSSVSLQKSILWGAFAVAAPETSWSSLGSVGVETFPMLYCF